jgi:hypothetical protein
MFEDLKANMNKRKHILDEMKTPAEELESKQKDNDIGALQHSISVLDQDIGKKHKELEIRTHEVMAKKKEIRILQRKLKSLGVNAPEDEADFAEFGEDNSGGDSSSLTREPSELNGNGNGNGHNGH